MNQDEIRQQIAQLVDQYAAIEFSQETFDPSTTVIPPSGKVLDADELKNMVDASLDGWLTTGRFDKAFRKRLAGYL